MNKYKFHLVFFVVALVFIIATSPRGLKPIKVIGVVETKANKDVGAWYTIKSNDKKYVVTVKRQFGIDLGIVSCNYLEPKIQTINIFPTYYLVSQKEDVTNCH